MSVTLAVRDEHTPGIVDHEFTLEFPTERITVRELIRERVYQEVKDHNVGCRADFVGLVQPKDAKREIDWKEQFTKAIDAYEGNRLLVLVGERQTEGLEETIEITHDTEVTFLRLVPLVGG